MHKARLSQSIRKSTQEPSTRRKPIYPTQIYFTTKQKKEQLRKTKQETLPTAKASTPKSNTAQEIRNLSQKIAELSAQQSRKNSATLNVPKTTSQTPSAKSASIPAQPLPMPTQQRSATLPAFQPQAASYPSFQQTTAPLADSRPTAPYSVAHSSPAPSKGDLAASSVSATASHSVSGYQKQKDFAAKNRYWNEWMESTLEPPTESTSTPQKDSINVRTARTKRAEARKGFQELSAYQNMPARDAKKQFLTDWLEVSTTEDDDKKASNPLLQMQRHGASTLDATSLTDLLSDGEPNFPPSTLVVYQINKGA